MNKQVEANLSMIVSKALGGFNMNGRLSIQRPAVLLRWVFGSSPPNRTYTSPRIRLSTNNINLFIVTEFFVTLTTYGNSLSFASHHLFFAGSFPLKIF